MVSDIFMVFSSNPPLVVVLGRIVRSGPLFLCTAQPASEVRDGARAPLPFGRRIVGSGPDVDGRG